MGLIARIKSRMLNRPDVIEVEKVEGELSVPSLNVEQDITVGRNIKVKDSQTFVTLTANDIKLLQRLVFGKALYRHHVIITTEYSGAYKNLVFDIYSSTSTQIKKTDIPSAFAGKYYLCTGNIISSTGVTTGICHGKFEMVGGNPQVRGINSSGDEFYAGINNLSDTVEVIAGYVGYN